MHRRRTRHERSPLVGALLLAILVVAIPLARGGVDLWAEAGALAIALSALLVVGRGTTVVPGVVLALTGVIALLVLQVVPVPPLIHRLSPGAVRLFETSLAPVGLYPGARPLSLNPAATAREVGKAIADLAALVAAFWIANTHRRRHTVIVGLALSGIVTAAMVLGLALAGAGAFVAPQFPFVNRNHLASSLNLSALLALALALRPRASSRGLWLLGVAATCAVSILTLSRGGLVALLLGAAVFVALHVRSSSGEDRRVVSMRAGLTAVALLVAVGVAAYLALDPLVAKLGTTRAGADDLRWQLWRPALQVLRDFPVTGVGRGAFSDVFAGYQFASSTYQFTHVENDWLQAVLDLGIPGGLLLIGAFALTWLGAARRRDLSETEIGLLAGTAAVALQNLVDFSLEVLGVALPFAVAMGLLARRQRVFSVRPALLHACVGALTVLASAGTIVGWRHERGADQARVEGAAGGTATARAARDAAGWHPADWFPHAAAGVRLSAERRCREGMPWLLRAMALYPSAPSPHLGAARCLAGRDDVAARREYRLAILFGSPALPEAAAWYPGLGDLFDIAAATPDGTLELGAMLAQTRPSDALAAYRRALDEYSDERALLPLALLSARLQHHTDSVDYARRHEAVFKSDPRGYSVAATSLFQLGRDAEASAELERGLAASPGSVELLQLLAERAMASRRWTEARRLAEQMAPRSAEDVATKQLLLARTFAGQGRNVEAIERVRSATSAQPNREDLLVLLAELCEQTGRLDDAIDALRRASAVTGATPAHYAARIAALEAARMERALDERIHASP